MTSSADLFHPFATATLSALRVGGRVVATLTIRNTSESAIVELVTYGVPAGGTQGAPQFTIRGRRGVAAFKGPLIKRRAPEPPDFLSIPPGKGMRWEVDLTAHYDVDPSGALTIQYGFYHPTLAADELYFIKSNLVEVP